VTISTFQRIQFQRGTSALPETIPPSKSKRPTTASASNINLTSAFASTRQAATTSVIPSATTAQTSLIGHFASANLNYSKDVSIGVGVKTANYEVVFFVPLSSIESIAAGKPFSVSIDTKYRGVVSVGALNTGFELEARGTATFTSLNAFPVLSLEGNAKVGANDQFAGVAFKWSPGKPWEFSNVSNSKRGLDWKTRLSDKNERTIIQFVLSVEGKVTTDVQGNAAIAALGGLGGEASPGNEINLGFNGKGTISSPNTPLVIQVKGDVSLSLINDGDNGTWRIRKKVGVDREGKPIYVIKGTLNLPGLANSLLAAAGNFIDQATQSIPGIKEIRALLNPQDDVVTTDSQGTGLGNSRIPPVPTIVNPDNYKPAQRAPRYVENRTTHGYDVDLKRSARANKDSNPAFLVRALNEVANAPTDNPGFAQQLVNTMAGGGPVTNTVYDSRGQPVNIKWARYDSTHLEVEVSRREYPTSIHVVTAKSNGIFAWVPTVGPARRAPKPQIDTPTTDARTTYGYDVDLKRLARTDKDSNPAFLVRALNEVANAPIDNPAFALQLKSAMAGGQAVTNTVYDSKGRAVEITWFKYDKTHLGVEVRRDGKPIGLHVISAKPNGTYGWTSTVGPARRTTNQQIDTLTVAARTKYGSDGDLRKLARVNKDSNAAFLAKALDDVVNAPANNTNFARQLKDTMAGQGPITDTVFDSNGNAVNLKWSRYDATRLEVEVSRAGLPTSFHRVTANRDGSFAWDPTSGETRRLGLESDILKLALKDPNCPEGRMVRALDFIYYNVAKPENAELRRILLELSSTGRFAEEKEGKRIVRTFIKFQNKYGDQIRVNGGKGVITVTITPQSRDEKPFAYSTGVDANGVHKFKGSRERTLNWQ
jgi:hypothetical protein